MTDMEAVSETKKGNTEAFGFLFKKYNASLINWMQIQTKTSDVKDIAQETWIKAFRHIRLFIEGNFKAWLFTIAANAILDYWKKPEKRRVINFCYFDDFEIPEKDKYSEDHLEPLRDCICSIPEESIKNVVVLKTYTEMKHKDIVKVLNINSVNTSLSYYRRGMVRLKQMMNA